MDEVFSVTFFVAYLAVMVLGSMASRGIGADRIMSRQICKLNLPVPGLRWVGIELELYDVFTIAISLAFGALYASWTSNLPAGLGWLASFSMTITLLPATQRSILGAFLRAPFQRTVKLHRWAGYAFVVLVAAHIGYSIDDWGLEVIGTEVRGVSHWRRGGRRGMGQEGNIQRGRGNPHLLLSCLCCLVAATDCLSRGSCLAGLGICSIGKRDGRETLNRVHHPR